MSLRKSLLLRWFVEILTIACFFAILGPWFVVGAVRLNQPAYIGLYWQLMGLMVLSLALGYRVRAFLKYAEGTTITLATVFFVGLGLILVYFVVVYPRLGDVQSFAGIVGYFVLGISAWLMGLKRASGFYTNFNMQKHLVAGTVSLGICFYLIGNLRLGEDTFLRILPFVIFWLPGAIIATSMLRMLEFDQGVADNMTRLRGWLAPLLMLVAGCMILAVLLSIGTPWVIRFFQAPVAMIWRGFQFVMHYISYAFASIAFRIMEAFMDMAGQNLAEFEMLSPLLELQELEGTAPEAISPIYMIILRWLGVFGLLLLIILLVYHYIMKVRKRQEMLDPNETRESFTSAAALHKWGRLQAQKIADRFKQALFRYNAYKRQANAVEIYHALLYLAGRRGLERPPAMTAHSFQPQLHNLFLENKSEADSILHSFSDELYAERAASPQALEVLRNSLAQIKKGD